MNSLYLILNLSAISLPLLLSFDRKVAFYRNWRFLFPAIAIMAALFIGWDAIFTMTGVWGFNDAYLIGPRVLGLPMEEWLFFLSVPYACVFIYACLFVYLKSDPLKKIHRPFLILLALVLILTAALNYAAVYTSITFAATGIFILYVLYKRPPWLSMFLLAYLISLIPFLLLNGILTGSFIENQVVYYNSAHILNIRIITIPIEDSIYNLLMLLITVWFYEKFKSRAQKIL